MRMYSLNVGTLAYVSTRVWITGTNNGTIAMLSPVIAVALLKQRGLYTITGLFQQSVRPI
ncbi:MAG: hypothetical protein COB30_005140 [Ectothiorhodospiraceae bacterium]|nr:hypothetical protein [Ectothiorhodospiraceae bacterium]